jgi:ketosteroid isomerase-like protein
MSEVRRSIDEVNRRFVEMFNQGTPGRAAEQVYTADARLLPPDAPIVEGRDAAIKFWETAAQQLGIRTVQLTTVSLDIVGNFPYEIGHADVNLQSGQQVRFKYVVIWKQEDGRWRWHVDIWNTRS